MPDNSKIIVDPKRENTYIMHNRKTLGTSDRLKTAYSFARVNIIAILLVPRLFYFLFYFLYNLHSGLKIESIWILIRLPDLSNRISHK